MGAASKTAALAVYLCAGVACAALGWFAHAFWGMPAPSARGTSPRATFVAVDEVAAETFNPPEEFIGHVEPVQEMDVVAEIEGQIQEVKFVEGGEVKQGDLLFVINDERYAAEQGVARAEVNVAKRKVEQAKAEVENARRLLGRLQAADERGVTKTAIEEAETSLAVKRAALGSAEAAVSQAQAKLDRMAFDMKRTKILAPISGRIGKAFMHKGDFVSPSKGALAHIVQINPVRVSFPIPDRASLAWKRAVAGTDRQIGDTRRLRLRLADGTVYPHVGTWEFMDNEMSEKTATVLMRAQFPDPDYLLLAKEYVTVLADEADPKPVPVVPALAVAKSGSKTGVWLYNEDGTVSFREIEVGARADGKVRVEKGVEPGEKIVVQGVHKLGEGMRVTVVPASEFN